MNHNNNNKLNNKINNKNKRNLGFVNLVLQKTQEKMIFALFVNGIPKNPMNGTALNVLF